MFSRSHKVRKFLAIVFLALAAESVRAQAPGGSGAANSASPPSGGASGSATIENQMLTYDAMAILTERIADRLAAEICPADNDGNVVACVNHVKKTKDSPPATCRCATPQQFLLQDNNTLIMQTAASSFAITAERLAKSYKDVCEHPKGPFAEALPTGAGLTDVANLLTAIKSSATITNQTFQPTSASLLNLLTASFLSRDLLLRSATNPGNLPVAVGMVSQSLTAIDTERTKCRTTVNGWSNAPAGETPAEATARKHRIASATEQLKALDSEYADFRKLLTSQTADGTMMATVIKGTALSTALGAAFWILQPSFDGGGGDTRTRHWFVIDLFYPTWDVSYNGGAVVSYTLTDSTGSPKDAAMYHYMKDWTRWGGELWHTASPGKLLPKSANTTTSSE